MGDDDWVVDSLLGFLQSRTWRYPVDNFIEQNCTVFDTEDESKIYYTEIHSNYREMVDKLLGRFTGDLGITPEQLAEACSQSSTLGESHQSHFEQILATEDFPLFKSIMVHKNIDLELQALKLMEHQLGHSPEAYQPGAGDNQETVENVQKSRRLAEEEDERILREIMEQSKKEYERQKSHEDDEMKRQLQLAKKESLKDIEVSQKGEEDLATALQKKLDVSASLPSKGEGGVQDKDSKKDKHTSLASKSLPSGVLRKEAHKAEVLPPLTPTKKNTSVGKSADAGRVSDAASLWLANAKADIGRDKPGTDSKPLTSHASNMQDIKAREAYLRQQRDHLIKMKNKAKSEKIPNKQSTKSSSSNATSATEHVHSPLKVKQAKDCSLDEKERAAIAEGDKRKQTNSGVLCSAIADKLRKGQN